LKSRRIRELVYKYHGRKTGIPFFKLARARVGEEGKEFLILEQKEVPLRNRPWKKTIRVKKKQEM